jgi:hypothetical protein
MNWRRWSLIALIAGMAAIGYHPVLLPQPTAPAVEFTAEIVTRVAPCGATEARETARRIVARRRDGARVEIQFLRPGPQYQPVVSRTIYFPDELKHVIVYDQANLASTLRLAERTARALRAAASDQDCTTTPGDPPTTVIGEGVFLGFQVVKKEQRSEKSRWEFWEAPALNCERLYVRSEPYNQQGCAFQDAELIATRIELGEPSAQWFSVPAGASDLPPSELSRRLEGAASVDPSIRDKVEFYDKLHSPSGSIK